MTQSKEFYAETVEEALSKASESLDVPRGELEYEVLDSGSSGFLGIGGRDARIEVAIENFSELTEIREETENHDEDLLVGNSEDFNLEQATTEPSEEMNSEVQEEEILAPEELMEQIKNFVVSAVDLMGLDARVDVYDAGDFIAVDVSSAETGLFIGQKGETIDALQYLLNVAVYRDRPFLKRVIVDSEGYRQRRIEAVQGIAHRMARKTVREQRPMELPPMNSSERRVVHMFLKDNPQVKTDSHGNGDNRRVVVSPH